MRIVPGGGTRAALAWHILKNSLAGPGIMERRLQERLVGAGVLILALVLLGPLILDGGPRVDPGEAVAPGQRPDEMRTQTFEIGGRRQAPDTAPPSPVVAPPAPPPVEAPVVPREAPATAASDLTIAPAPEREAPAPAGKPPVTPAVPAAELPPATPAAPAAGGFLVQVGTFAQEANAQRLTATLKQRGFEAFVSPLARGGKTLYRVRVGPAGPRDEAAEQARRLAAAGHPGQVVAR